MYTTTTIHGILEQMEYGSVRFGTDPTASPQSGIKSPSPDPGFVPALAGSRWLVVQIKTMKKKDDLSPL